LICYYFISHSLIAELGRAQFIPQRATSAIAKVVLRFIAFRNWIAEVALRNCIQPKKLLRYIALRKLKIEMQLRFIAMRFNIFF